MREPVHVLGEDLTALIDGHDVIVFDGECALCSGFFRFVLRHDTARRYRFALAQSTFGQACYTRLDLPLDDFETNLVIIDGEIFTKLDAFAAVMRGLGWPYRALAVLIWLPRWLKAPVYHCIARNRYRVFGRYDTCMIPDQALQSRFLPGGW